MNRIDEKLWPAMEPPPGFADALVERLLVSDAHTRTRSRSRYRVIGILLAAIFVSGAAFGISAGLQRRSSAGTERAVPFAQMPSVSRHLRINQVTVPRHSNVIVSTKERVPLKSAQTVATAAPPAVAPTAPVAPPRVPACQCQRGFADMICDCY
ncbi:MAG TPA: hypothetical protein VKP30_17310 [Polyangiaceae bacterium]|nr:hypothetical protein [Polyangiaceae bacterium]